MLTLHEFLGRKIAVLRSGNRDEVAEGSDGQRRGQNSAFTHGLTLRLALLMLLRKCLTVQLYFQSQLLISRLIGQVGSGTHVDINCVP
jgi:hypothetical protein